MALPVYRKCFAPSEGVSSQTAGLFGAIAETTIALFYLRHRKKLVFFPLSDTDFQDVIGGFSNLTLYRTFLVMKHPRLIARLDEMKRRLGGGTRGTFTKIPDLLTADADLTVFYEIKPNSPDGLSSGVTKISNIGAFMSFFGLPYRPGTAWSPNTRILVFKGIMFEIEVKVYFHFFRFQPGLILYEICIEAGVAIEDIVAKLIVGSVVLMIVFGPEILAAAAAAAAAAAEEAAVVAALAATWTQVLRAIPALAP